MNKQELIKKYKRLEGVWDAPGAETARQIFIQDLEQLDEPEKVKIPQFVAEYIKKAKNYHWDLHEAMKWVELEDHKELKEYFYIAKNIETFARAWLDGYEVEKEPKYIVKLKGIEKEKCYLNYNFGRVWLFYNQENFYGYRAHHTRKELEEAGFGWVFDCEGIEIEEVTE